LKRKKGGKLKAVKQKVGGALNQGGPHRRGKRPSPRLQREKQKGEGEKRKVWKPWEVTS